MTQHGAPGDPAGGDYYESENFEGANESFRGRRAFERNIKSKTTWLRLVFMLVMMMLFALAGTVTMAVIVIQFFWVLFTGEPKEELKLLGRQLASYAAETYLYLTFNTDERPFPFDRPWPTPTTRAAP